MNVAEVLRAAAKRFAEDGTWITGMMAVSEFGYRVSPCSEKAKCWCSLGAIDSTGATWENVGDAIHFFGRFVGGNNIAEWNDAPGRTQAEVVEAFEAAAEKWERENGASK